MHRRRQARVAFEINVGPREAEQGAQDEQPGVIDEPTHGMTIVGPATGPSHFAANIVWKGRDGPIQRPPVRLCGLFQ